MALYLDRNMDNLLTNSGYAILAKLIKDIDPNIEIYQFAGHDRLLVEKVRRRISMKIRFSKRKRFTPRLYTIAE